MSTQAFAVEYPPCGNRNPHGPHLYPANGRKCFRRRCRAVSNQHKPLSPSGEESETK